MLVFRTLSLFLLLHVEELKHHFLHEIIEKLLVMASALLIPPIFISIVVVLRIEPVRESALAYFWTIYPLNSLFVVVSCLGV